MIVRREIPTHGLIRQINSRERKEVNQCVTALHEKVIRFFVPLLLCLVWINCLTFTRNWSWTLVPKVSKQSLTQASAGLTVQKKTPHRDTVCTSLKLCICFHIRKGTCRFFSHCEPCVQCCDIWVRPFDMTCLKGPCYSNWFHNALSHRQISLHNRTPEASNSPCII